MSLLNQNILCKFTYQYKIMSRYSLRNQEKIKDTLGEDFLQWLNKSLKDHFENTVVIEEYSYKGGKYKYIHVQNVQPKTDSFFELYVISKIYDVYNLAYFRCYS